jgi:DDE superfamily endonuclease
VRLMKRRPRRRHKRGDRRGGDRPWMIGPGRAARRVCPPQARHVVVSVAGPAGRARDGRGLSPASVRDLARWRAGRGAGLTRRPATVQRLLTARGRTPPRVRSWLTRPDPACQRQLDEIVTRELAPPRHRRWWGRDEKTGLPALDRRSPSWPRRPGQIERREFEYIRHGVVDLFAAFDVRTGQVFGQCYTHHSNVELRHFLRGLRARDPDRRWHLILDNASYHTKPEVLAWCAAEDHAALVALSWFVAQPSGNLVLDPVAQMPAPDQCGFDPRVALCDPRLY